MGDYDLPGSVIDLPQVHDDLLGGVPRLPRSPILSSRCWVLSIF